MRYKVLQVFTTLQRGGMERQTLNLVRALRASDEFEVHVAALGADGPIRAELAELGIHRVPLFPLRRLYDVAAARQFVAFIRLLRSFSGGVDIIHTHDFYTNTFALPAAALCRVPVRIGSRRELDVFSGAQRRVERTVLRLASAVAANCETLRHELIAEGVAERKVRLLTNGVDRRCADDAAARRFRTDLDIPAGVPVVSMLANLHNTRKDFGTFVRAAARIRSRMPDTVFVIAGGGDPGEVQSLAAAHDRDLQLLTPGVLMDIEPLLSATSVLVHTAHSEGLPNSVLEAMACGIPVVATAVGGIPELVQNRSTGFTVAPGDADSVAAHVIDLLADSHLAKSVGERGQQHVRQHYSLEQQTEALFELYGEMLRQAGRG